MKTYRAAVIGCSRMGGFIDNEIAPGDLASPLPYSHAACYEACERTELVACADLREDVMAEFGERYGIPKERQYTDYRELIDRERPDIVSAATQPEERAGIIVYAVENGAKAIWAEKALCASLQDADAIVEAVERNGAVLNMGTQKRFHPGFDVVKRVIDGGELGALRAMVIYNNFALWDGSSHYFDVVKLLNDDGPVAWIQGHVPGGIRGFTHGTDYDNFEGDVVPGDPSSHGIIQFRNGVVAYALLTGRGADYDVVCERGTMSYIDHGRDVADAQADARRLRDRGLGVRAVPGVRARQPVAAAAGGPGAVARHRRAGARRRAAGARHHRDDRGLPRVAPTRRREGRAAAEGRDAAPQAAQGAKAAVLRAQARPRRYS